MKLVIDGLSVSQARQLHAVADAERLYGMSAVRPGQFWTRPNTLESLAERDLLEEHKRGVYGFVRVYSLTDSGWEWIARNPDVEGRG